MFISGARSLAISSCSMTLFTLLWACNETLATTWSRRQRLWWQSCFRMLWSPPSYIWSNPFRKRKIETRMASLEQSRVYFRGRCRLYTCSTQMSGSDETVLLLPEIQYRILDSIVVSIPACHAGDRGSIPRRGELFLDISQDCGKRVLLGRTFLGCSRAEFPVSRGKIWKYQDFTKYT